MKIRLEVARAPSLAWRWFLRVAKRVPGYRVEDGRVHIIETEDRDAILALWSIVRPWKRVAVYVDGRLISRQRLGVVLAQADSTRRMLAGIIKKKALERDDNERRRGLGF